MTSIFKNIFKILFGIAIGLFISELLLRFVYTPEVLSHSLIRAQIIVDNDQSQIAIWDRQNLRFKPNSQSIITHPEYKFTATHDKHGFRNICFKEKEKNNLIVGDSFVYGIGVEDNEILSCLLNRSNKGTSFYNLSFPGASPHKYLELIKAHYQNLLFLNSDTNVIVTIFMGNDYELLLNLYEGDIEILEKDTQTKYLKSINFFINNTGLKNLYVIQAIKLILLETLNSKDYGEYVISKSGSTFYKFSSKSNLIELKRSLNYLKNFIDGLDLNLQYILFIPDPIDLDEDRLIKEMDLISVNYKHIDVGHKYKVAIEACKHVEISCLDIRDVVSIEDYYSYDNHLKKSGYEKIRKYLTKYH